MLAGWGLDPVVKRGQVGQRQRIKPEAQPDTVGTAQVIMEAHCLSCHWRKWAVLGQFMKTVPMSPTCPRAFCIPRVSRMAVIWPTYDEQHLHLVGRRELEFTASSEALCRRSKS